VFAQLRDVLAAENSAIVPQKKPPLQYLDHMLFWTTVDLENKLLDFKTYFNNQRTHTAREGRTPDPPASRPIANLRSFRWQPHCRSLYQTPVAA
jgi:hypothetical protein